MSGHKNVYTLDPVNFTAGNLYKENQKRKKKLYVHKWYICSNSNKLET